MEKDPYNYKNCQALFGYAKEVHIKYKGQCQLCGCGSSKIDFDLWRQMTVEHLIGKSQGGRLRQIRLAVENRFKKLKLSDADIEKWSDEIHQANTVSACSFCNSTTSRDVNPKSMTALIQETDGTPQEVLKKIKSHLKGVLLRKKANAKWKRESVLEAFEREIRPKLEK